MHSLFQAFSLFIFIIFHSVADETSRNIDTQVNTNSILISDVQQAPFTGNPLGQAEPGLGSSINAGTSSDELLTGESNSCLDINQYNPQGKSRVRRGSPPSDFCPLVPKAEFTESPKEPEAGQNAGDVGRSGPSRRRTKKPMPSRIDPLNVPIFSNGETIENPCTGYTIAKTPVCDSGYFGPTTNLAACRLCTFYPFFFSFFLVIIILRTKMPQIFMIFAPGTPYLDCIYNLENLWCCVIVRLGVSLECFFPRPKNIRLSLYFEEREHLMKMILGT